MNKGDTVFLIVAAISGLIILFIVGPYVLMYVKEIIKDWKEVLKVK